MKINSISELTSSKIKPKMTISLGGGSTVFKLAQAIAQHNLNITLYSPSELTCFKCIELGLELLPSTAATKIDIAFDGCDSIDKNFNVLKSLGGIHLFEKQATQIAKQFILLLPSERIQPVLNPKIPLCLEVSPPCVNQVQKYLSNLHLTSKIRQDKSVAIFTRTPLGNYLIDVFNEDWHNISELNRQICLQNGVVSSSLFEDLATSLITEKDGKIIELKRGNNHEKI